LMHVECMVILAAVRLRGCVNELHAVALTVRLSLIAAKPRAKRPGSRVAEGHREATRSALDAGRGAWTMCAGGEGRYHAALRPKRRQGTSAVFDGCRVVHGSAARRRRAPARGAHAAAYSLLGVGRPPRGSALPPLFGR
jgi:hypothetical protein